MNEKYFDVSNDIVIITGISGQLGYEYAITFLKQGSVVVGIDIKEPKNIKKLQNSKHKFKFIHCDVTNKSNLKDALNQTINTVGVPTVLINNAGIDSPPSSSDKENGPFENYPESSWDNVLNVNLKGVFLCCQTFGSVMAENKQGSIINISSIYGLVSPDQKLYEYRRKNDETFYKPIAYSASKSGIFNLTRYLAVYWAKENVRVNTLTIAGVFNNQDSSFLQSYCERIPIGRMANPDDYFGPILFLASRSSQYVTGHNLIADGGWTSI